MASLDDRQVHLDRFTADSREVPSVKEHGLDPIGLDRYWHRHSHGTWTLMLDVPRVVLVSTHRVASIFANGIGFKLITIFCSRVLTWADCGLVLFLRHAESGSAYNGRGEMPAGSLHRPMVSAGPGEQGVRQRRIFDVPLLLFDNSVDCTRQPENEKASKTRWMRDHPSRCEEPLREAGVRAAIPDAAVSVVRRPLQRRDGLHRTGSKQGARACNYAGVTSLMRPVFLPQPFEVRVDPSRGPRGLWPGSTSL